MRNAECGVLRGASMRKRPPVQTPRSAFRVPTSHDAHHSHRRPPELPRPRGREAAPGRRGHVRRRAEALVGAAHRPGRRNRIPLALRCLLVEHDAGLVLIDTGLRNKEGDKFKDIYGVANEGREGRTRLEDSLAELGYGPEEVRWVINTHLHFAHAGGNTWCTGEGRILPAFPQATYVVQRGELEFARHTNERTQASYLAHNFEAIPFQTGGGEGDVLAGIRCGPTPGHAPS